MRAARALLFVIMISGCAGPPRADAPAEKTAEPGGGWRPIFDGRTLDGWVQRGGRAEFRVEDGAIVGATRPGQPNSFLCTREEFSDFELDLEFKVDDDLNSGVQVRSNARAEAALERVYGYQVEIDPGPRAWTGGIYEEAGRGWLVDLANNPDARGAFRPGDWNHFRVQCAGPAIRTWINGVPAADFEDSLTARGFIGLQVHGVGERRDPLEVRWRKLRLRDLNGR